MLSRKNIILLFACAAVFFEALDIAIINLAMPLIQKQFAIANDNVHWAQTLYVLLYGGFLIAGGKMADLFGRKWMFMVGSALFLVTSLGAGLSSGFFMLVAFRALQGLAAAIVMPAALSIITNTFTESHERSKAIGIFSSFAAIGSGCGLSLGGMLATWIGWQWIFFINVPVIAITLWIGGVYIDKDEPNQSKTSPDFLSGVILTSVILLVSYLVHMIADLRSHLALFVLIGTAILAGVVLFIKRSRSQQNPLIEKSLFESATTRTGIGVAFLLGAFFTGYLFVISIVFQTNMQYSAAITGLLLFPFSILSALTGKFILPVLLRRYRVIHIAVLGMSLMVLGGCALLISMNMGYPLTIVLISVACVTGLGIAISFTSLMVMSVQSVPMEHHGVATGLVSTSNFLGGGLGLSLLSVFMNGNTPINSIAVFVLTLYGVAAVLILLGVVRMYSRAESVISVVRN